MPGANGFFVRFLDACRSLLRYLPNDVGESETANYRVFCVGKKLEKSYTWICLVGNSYRFDPMGFTTIF